MRQNILQFGSSRSLHVSSISMNMTRIKYIPKKNLVHLLTTPHLKVKKPSLECWSISNSVTSFINRNVTQDLAPDSLSFSHLSFASAMSTALSAAPRSSWSPRTHGRLENETTSRMMNLFLLFLFWGYIGTLLWHEQHFTEPTRTWSGRGTRNIQTHGGSCPVATGGWLRHCVLQNPKVAFTWMIHWY